MDNKQNFNILEQLYYGNIDPNAKSFDRNSKYAEMFQVICDNEDKLNESLDGKEKSMFLDFVNAESEILVLSEVDIHSNLKA